MATLRFFDWSENDAPGFFLDVDPGNEAGWSDLREYLTPRKPSRPFEQIIRIAKGHGVRTVFVENRYIDLDFRNQHGSFYGTTFQRHPTVCHRVHFFTGEIESADFTELKGLATGYKGYSVIRPLETSPVGRTMISPPERLQEAALCLAAETSHLYGYPMTVRAMPFMSQDSQYFRCAHAALWMMMYHAHLAHAAPRRLPSEIHDAGFGGMVTGRQVPHDGLSHQQILGALHTLGYAASNITLPVSSEDSINAKPLALPQTICRYVNSQMPPMVYNPRHAWLVVGYYHSEARPSHDNVRFICHDDELGPYVEEGVWEGPSRLHPWSDGDQDSARWMAMIPPLPSKIYITAERAELIGQERLEHAARRLTDQDNPFVKALEADRVRYRSYAIDSRKFKAEHLADRLPDKVESIYRDTHFPKYIWVVEAIDNDLADHPGAECVVGEAVIDGTAHHLAEADDPALIARNVGGNVKATSLDFGETQEDDVRAMQPYPSAVPKLPAPRSGGAAVPA